MTPNPPRQDGPSTRPKVGSLCTGYGGLDLAVCDVLDATTAWVADIDPGACKILTHRFRGVPNLGDITAVDWATVEPVDVLTGGTPCQDLSHAGKRAGMRPETRSGLWSHMAYAISVLRPRLVVWENVRGAFSAAAASDVEQRAWCVGGAGDSEPALRALGCVVGDLADLGYDARWVGVRASDVGAPHGRFRVFLVAEPGDSDSVDREGRSAAGLARETGPAVGSPADPDGVGRERFGHSRGWRSGDPDRHHAPTNTGRHPRPEDDPDVPATPRDRGEAPADTPRDGRREGRPEPTRIARGPDVVECGADAAAHTDSDTVRTPTQPLPGSGDPALTGDPVRWGVYGPAADGHPEGLSQSDEPWRGDEAGLPVWTVAGAVHRDRAGDPAERVHDVGRTAAVMDWGVYGPAIARWERVLGRPAPPPTEATKAGQRLSARFVEWLMGLPEGWVTDVPRLSRRTQLQALGNGVVPAQSAYALRLLLAMDARRSAAS